MQEKGGHLSRVRISASEQQQQQQLQQQRVTIANDNQSNNDKKSQRENHNRNIQGHQTDINKHTQKVPQWWHRVGMGRKGIKKGQISTILGETTMKRL